MLAVADARNVGARGDDWTGILLAPAGLALCLLGVALLGPDRGVVGEGAVGSRWAAWLSIFRYELRVWHDGVIPDVAEAVESPRRLTDDPGRARQLLALASSVPTPVWGRDELRAGEMWNSNSVVAWLVARSGLDADAIRPPAGGRAPGWGAGLVLARRAPGSG